MTSVKKGTLLRSNDPRRTKRKLTVVGFTDRTRQFLLAENNKTGRVTEIASTRVGLAKRGFNVIN